MNDHLNTVKPEKLRITVLSCYEKSVIRLLVALTLTTWVNKFRHNLSTGRKRLKSIVFHRVGAPSACGRAFLFTASVHYVLAKGTVERSQVAIAFF